MAEKTNPIGVRFNKKLLEELKEKKIADSPQKALSFYEGEYQVKKQIIADRNTPRKIPEELKEYPLTTDQMFIEKTIHSTSPPTPASVIKTASLGATIPDKPIRQEGESGMNYAIRVSTWKDLISKK